MAFNRHLSVHLEEWKKRSSRKPLILRGARQVGKTTLVKNFSKSYKHRILLNLERADDKAYFEKYNDATEIAQVIFLDKGIPFTERTETILFIDEIQESQDAIFLLRYFKEDLPDMHVVAAGSLLEHVMTEVKSFPVGRVEYLYLYPLNFLEYLEAIDRTDLVQLLSAAPIPNYAHQVFMGLFHEYAIIGGMPEVVQSYLDNKSLSDLTKVYESIWETYKNDIEKYEESEVGARVIRHIMDVAYLYLDERIKFQNFGNSNYKSREVGEAMRKLDDAKVIQLIYPTTSIESPIKPDIKKSPRLQFLDTGLVNYAMKIQGQMLALDDLSTSYKGALIPHLITQELLSLSAERTYKPNFWVREKRQSSAEVDLVLQHRGKIIPIEIKSGAIGKLRSLHQFIDRCDHPYAVRIYGGKFSVERHTTPIGRKEYLLMNLPYYLGTQIYEYIEYFVSEY